MQKGGGDIDLVSVKPTCDEQDIVATSALRYIYMGACKMYQMMSAYAVCGSYQYLSFYADKWIERIARYAFCPVFFCFIQALAKGSLTLSQTSPGFYLSAVQVFRKHCGKRSNYW